MTGTEAPATGEPTWKIRDLERYVAVDNVCAWPNLTVLRDGTIVAVGFNKPSHGGVVGDTDSPYKGQAPAPQ